jgi:nitroreductase
MNPKLQFIFDRRSVRQYSDAGVGDDLVQDLLEAAMAAPSAVAKDPWHFIVVRDRERLARLAEGLPNGKMLADAALGIIVCGDIEEAHGNLESYMLQDCSAAVENILLAATALGLGACWLGVHPRTERMAHLKDVLGLPDNVTALAGIAIGYPSAPPEARTRYSASKVHHETW